MGVQAAAPAGDDDGPPEASSDDSRLPTGSRGRGVTRRLRLRRGRSVLVVIGELEGELAGAYPEHLRRGVRACVHQCDDPPGRYDAMVATYLWVSPFARTMRCVLVALIVTIEVVAPLALGMGAVAQGASPGWAVVLTAAAAAVLLSPYRTLRGHSTWRERASWLTLGAVPGAALNIVNPTESPWADVLGLLIPPTFVLAGTLAAVIAVHLLRRQRCHVVGPFMTRQVRAEIVCELVQVRLLVNRTRAAVNGGTSEKQLLVEKLDRLRHLYRIGALFAASSVRGTARRQEMRRSRARSRDLRRQRNMVDLGSVHMGLMPLAAELAAEVLTEARATDTGPSVRWAAVGSGLARWARRLALAAVFAGSILLMRAFDITDGFIYSSLAVGLITTIVVPVVRQLDPTADMSWMKGLLGHLLHGRRGGRSDKEPATADPAGGE